LNLLNDIGCNVKVLVIPETKDPDEFIKTKGVDEFRNLVNNSISLIEYKIRVLKKQINIETIEGKISFLNKIADILSRLDNNVEREMYVKKLAKEYEISEESIFTEILKRIKPRATFKTVVVNPNNIMKRTNQNEKDDLDSRILHDEKMVLALLCVDNSVYKFVRDIIHVNDFTEGENKRIAGEIFDRLENNRGIVPGELLNILDEKLANQFARIIKEECNCDDNKKAILGKIKSMELYKIEKRQKEIIDLLKNEGSLKEGDVETLKSELKSLTILMQKKKRM